MHHQPTKTCWHARLVESAARHEQPATLSTNKMDFVMGKCLQEQSVWMREKDGRCCARAFRRDRNVRLALPAFHARGSASPFRTRCCHQLVSAPTTSRYEQAVTAASTSPHEAFSTTALQASHSQTRDDTHVLYECSLEQRIVQEQHSRLASLACALLSHTCK